MTKVQIFKNLRIGFNYHKVSKNLKYTKVKYWRYLLLPPHDTYTRHSENKKSLKKWLTRALDTVTKLKTTELTSLFRQTCQFRHRSSNQWPSYKCSKIHVFITKTYLYNFDPLKPHFYIVQLGFTGVYIIFLISAQNIDCGYSLEPPRRGGSNEYPQSMFCAEIWKISEFFYLKIFSCWR